VSSFARINVTIPVKADGVSFFQHLGGDYQISFDMTCPDCFDPEAAELCRLKRLSKKLELRISMLEEELKHKAMLLENK
jgi:hypothetical protein